MPRIARILIPNAPHHVTQRGNNRQDVFFADFHTSGIPEFMVVEYSF